MAGSRRVTTRGSGASGADDAGPGHSLVPPPHPVSASPLQLLPSTAACPACRIDERPSGHAGTHYPYRHVALLRWPRLDRAALARARDDPRKIARLVARRTAHPFEVILAILTGKSDED